MKNAVLMATHYGIDIYKHVLRLFYPENYQWKTDGSAVMVKNPYNENSPTLQIKIHPTVNSKIARHFDVAKPDFYGDCFDFAALYYKCGGDELLRKLNNELYLHIGDEYRDQEPVRFSFFRRPINSLIPYKNVTLKNVYEVIIGGYYKAITERLRAITDKKQAREYKATNFDYCTFSGTFNSRRADALIQHSGLMCLDFDHIADVEDLKSRLLGDTMFETQLLFRSPSGDGLKWVISIDKCCLSHSEYFTAVANYIKFTYGVEVDRSGRDVCRACFLPYDPDAYKNPNI